MIGHDGVRVQLDQALLLRALQRGQGAHCDARVLPPKRPDIGAIEGLVNSEKTSAGKLF